MQTMHEEVTADLWSGLGSLSPGPGQPVGLEFPWSNLLGPSPLQVFLWRLHSPAALGDSRGESPAHTREHGDLVRGAAAS